MGLYLFLSFARLRARSARVGVRGCAGEAWLRLATTGQGYVTSEHGVKPVLWEARDGPRTT